MKKTLLLFVALVGCLTLSAQESEGRKKLFEGSIAHHPVVFGIRGGVNFNGFGPDVAKVFSGSLKANTYTGWNLGLIVDCPILECFYFQPGFFYKAKGFKLTGRTPDASRKALGKANYLQFPLLFSYRYNLKRGMQFEFNLGPYIAVGMNGTVTDYTYYTDDDLPTRGINSDYAAAKDPDIVEREFFGDDLDESFGIKKSDIGLCIGVGMTVNRFYIGLQYDLGLKNLRNDVCWSERTRFYNRNLTIMLGFNIARY